MTIVHISSDFPDPIVPGKTRVIANLLDLTAGQFDHFVYSLNRITPSIRSLLRGAAPAITIGAERERLIALSYEAPPKGLFLRTLLERLADWIGDDMARRGIKPDLVHGHKLSMEGIVAARLAARFGVPYALTVQGNSDRSILSARPDLHRRYADVYHGAAALFAFTPWALDFLVARFGERRGGPGRTTIILPCPTPQDAILAPQIVGPHLMSAFHLVDYRNKNAVALIEAAAVLAGESPDFRLDIHGGGPPAACRALEKTIARTRTAAQLRLAGPLRHEAMQARMNGAAGFVLVSRKESFGLVFIEALLAGCPVVYPRGWAIDGFFEGHSFAIPARADDRRDIIDAMRRLARDEEALKADLARWQSSGAPAAFQRDAIARTYAAGLVAAVDVV